MSRDVPDHAADVLTAQSQLGWPIIPAFSSWHLSDRQLWVAALHAIAVRRICERDPNDLLDTLICQSRLKTSLADEVVGCDDQQDSSHLQDFDTV